MQASDEREREPRCLRLFDRSRLCRVRTLCFVCAAWLLCAGFIRPAHAQERGAIGAELSAGIGLLPRTSDGMYQPDFTLREGLSAWYRPRPAFALGFSVGEMNSGDLDGANFSRDTFLKSGSVYEAFAEGRLFPTSTIGAFGRVSAGMAHLTLVPTFMPGPSHENTATQPVLELEAGPELRLFLTSPSTGARPGFFLRVRGTATAMSAATFLGYGLSLGFEG